ncbi:peptidylprolyl isomerase [Henriciella marina]|uniref:peptidylprolyl isomerase n=1 Tax=Henriciella marina TaxID=453851 RepID=UPI000360EAB6|nr:peptidylprolyl isomerase [Henriciella marina]
MHRQRFSFIVLALASAFAIGACDQSDGPSDVRRPVGFDASAAALVNGDPIYLSDVELEAVAQGRIEPGDAFGPEHDDYELVLDQLIDQRLLAQEAVRRGLDRTPAAQRRLETARERLLGNFLMEDLVATQVNEAAIDRMYEEQVRLQQLDDEVRIRHILLETQEEAQTVLEQARAGEDFTALAFENSEDTRTRLDGGSFGWVSPNDMIEPFPAVIADTPAGEISEPFQSEQGWHIVKVEQRRTRPPKTREEMRPEIVTYLTFTQISQILQDLRASAEIEQRDGDLVARRLAEDAGDADEESTEQALPADADEGANADETSEDGMETPE